MSRARSRELAGNPFYVLELQPDCSRIEIERAGQKLLAMLEIGIGGADSYSTPFGPRPRTPELVRESMAVLRDPRRRLVAEMWARADVGESTATPAEPGPEPDTDAGWPGAMAAFGFGGRR